MCQKFVLFWKAKDLGKMFSVPSWVKKIIFSSFFVYSIDYSLDNAMDGEAICQALGAVSGPDALKDILPRFGERLKVYNAIKAFLNEDLSQKVQNM